jgi:hypothetical protein
MNLIRGLVVFLAAAQGGWLTYDGGRALVVGDYVTRSSGPRAGELGPWSRLVSSIGLDPRSNMVKAAHVALGLAWLSTAMALVMRRRSARTLAFLCSVATLWYLPVGTVASVLVIGLLLIA